MKLKVDEQLIRLIKAIRIEFNFGPTRISTYLLRKKYRVQQWGRVLDNEQIPKIKRYRKSNEDLLCNKLIPGERVQIDVTKMAPK